MALIKCKECGKEISDKATKCIHCGAPIEIEVKKTCPDCGKEYVGNKCMNCGYVAKDIPEAKDNKGNDSKKTNPLTIILETGVFIFSIVLIWLFVQSHLNNGMGNVSGTYVNRDTGDKIVIKGNKGSFTSNGKTYQFSNIEKYKESGIYKIDFTYNGETSTCLYDFDFIECYNISYDKQ